MEKKGILGILIPTIIMIGAIVLRLLYINNALWYDEACSWFSAKQSFPFGIMDNLLHLDLQHTPLYFIMLHFWMNIFGESEVSMRILSLLFSIAAIPLVYTAATKISDKKQALYATALVTVSPLLVLFSVEVRMYPIVIFLVLLSLNYLIDFEQKRNIKSLIKLIIVNVIIPYTFVGGIFYNISLFINYSIYLWKNRKDDLKKYVNAWKFELILLIPYFFLISYYAKMRNLFVIKHEGQLLFMHIVDVIRNFFGSTTGENIYWPIEGHYNLTLLFTILVIVPCIYFVYGILQGAKTSDKFLKTIYMIFLGCFGLSILLSLFEINIFTSRYILYILPPLFILSVIGLSNKLSEKHFRIFVTLFIISATMFNILNAKNFKYLKIQSFKAVKEQADELNLTANDMIIMPFGSDAPYYFRALSSPMVLNFDFHKEVRNPYNNKYYDENQQEKMAGKNRSRAVYDSILSRKIFSTNYFNWFVNNVNTQVSGGHYVLIALYGSDANALTDMKTLRDSIPGEHVIEQRMLEIMFKKYLFDIGTLLDLDFNFIKRYQHGNYTYFLYQKK